MRDLAKLKILEVSAISWQYTGWSLAYLQHFGVLLGLRSAIGPEMTGFGQHTFTFNVTYSFNSKIFKYLILVYNGARCVHICKIYAVKTCAKCVRKGYLSCVLFCKCREFHVILLVRCAKGAELVSFAVHFWSSLDSLLGSWSWVRIERISCNSRVLWANCAKSG